MFNFGRGKLREYCQAASLFVNVVCVVAGAGRFADWLSTRSRIDLEFSVGFLLTSILIFAFSSDRLFLLSCSLLATAVLGTINSILRWTPVALPVILPCWVIGVATLFIRARLQDGAQ